jgi:hypothetical protein
LKKKSGTILAAIILFIIVFSFHSVVHARWGGWNVKKELNLDDSPLDVAESTDGKWLFILTPREVLFYSIAEDKINQRFAVDKTYDRLMYSARNSALILTSRSDKALQIIQLDKIHELTDSGLPFIGNENAPITLAVFSDYQ